MQKKVLPENIIRSIIENKELSQIELAKKHGTTRWVIQRTIKELGLQRVYRKPVVPVIPEGAKKKEFFNYDVYSSGHVFNRNTNKFVSFRKKSRTRIVRGKEYVENISKRSNLSINHEGVKKIINISLANLIGILFVPNPNKCKYIHFKEGGKNNCDYKNLYWSDKHFRSGRIKIMPQKLMKMYLNMDYERLSKFDRPVYSWIVEKDIELLAKFFIKEKTYFTACMIDAWTKCIPSESPNKWIIKDMYDLFRNERILSLIERGFYVPSIKYYPNDKRFIFYCRNNLMGSVKDFLFRVRPKEDYVSKLKSPTSHVQLRSYQTHNFD